MSILYYIRYENVNTLFSFWHYTIGRFPLTEKCELFDVKCQLNAEIVGFVIHKIMHKFYNVKQNTHRFFTFFLPFFAVYDYTYPPCALKIFAEVYSWYIDFSIRHVVY